MIFKIPLAWLQLTREKIRLLVAIAGISFADILMFMQFGFRDALFESSVTFHSNVQGDIFLISTQSTALIAMKPFPQRRLYQTLAFAEVASITPIYLGFGLWRNPENRNTRQLLVIGFNPTHQVFNLPGIQQYQNRTKLEDVVLFDADSRSEFGPIAQMFAEQGQVITEVGSRKITVEGLFNLGASFGADGNIITSDLNFLRMFPDRQKGLIDVGVIKVKPGTDIPQLVAQIRRQLPNDVLVFSREEFVKFERDYWENSTAIGFVFNLGAAMGFIVGLVIVYQILYTDVADHLPEYATLKAMGYRDSYLLSVVLQEALILAIVGYLPSLGVAHVLYQLARNATSLPMRMTLVKATQVFCLTIIMCCVSGAIAMRKLQEADPADIF